MNKTLCLMLLAALPAAAQQLSPQQALERALQSTSATRQQAPSLNRTSAASFKLVETRGPLYVFTDSKQNKTLIAPADARLRPVVAQIDGDFSVNDMPPAMSWLLDQYQAEAATLSATAATTSNEVGDIAKNYASWTPIEPLVKAKWNQLAPYNALCPQGTVTGCVATAMAQVVYTNRFAECQGQISYDWNGQTLSYDFSKANIDFDAMTPTYGAGSTDEAEAAVANLMYACGTSIQTYYGPESTANPAAIGPALATYFGYDQRFTKINWRPYYQTADWERMLYTELAAGRSMVYGGTTATNGAHAFVVDGYSDNGLFHINWGWGGSHNGYFSMSVLNPYSNDINAAQSGFSKGQYAIFITKPGAENPQVVYDPEPLVMEDLSGFKVLDFAASDGFYINHMTTLSFKILNTGKEDYNDYIHVGLFDSDDVEICYNDHMNTVVPPGDIASISIELNVQGEKELQLYPGAHKIKIQDHMRRTIAEFDIEVKDGEPQSGWDPGELSFYIDNLADYTGTTIISGKRWGHSPRITNLEQQTVDLKLVFYVPGTDTSVDTIQAFNKSMASSNGVYYDWETRAPRITLPFGIYDVCYVTNNAPCSPRATIGIGTNIDGIAYAPRPAVDANEAIVLSRTYKGDVQIPEKITVEDKEYTVTAIDDAAFFAQELTSLSLPAGISSIGYDALRFTQSMRHLVIRSPRPPFVHAATCTYGMHYAAAAYVPADSYDAYAPLFTNHHVYSLVESLSATAATTKIKKGEQAVIDVNILPASTHINPDFSVVASTEGIVDVTDAKLNADGKLQISLSAVDYGTTELTVSTPQPGVSPLTVTVEVNDQSAITEINAETEAGQTIYDLSGRRLSKPVRGINIINGRKVLVR